MTKKARLAVAIMSIVYTIGIMAFATNDSFNPTNEGFWKCLFGGAVWGLLMYFFVFRYSFRHNKSAKR